jgi:hypothetical protein
MTNSNLRNSRRITAIVLTSGVVAAWLSACGGDDSGGGSVDAGPDALVGLDSGTHDAGTTNGSDTGSPFDSSPPGDFDTGYPEDTGSPTGNMDAGADVSAPVDAGHDSSVPTDASIPDSGGGQDSGGGVDAAGEDAGGSDAGSGEDAGGPDAGVDAASEDSGGSEDSGFDAADANVCGNGVVDPGEQCDLGAANSDLFSSCSTTCTTTSLLLHLDASNPSGNGTLPDDNTPLAAWVDLAVGRSVVQNTVAYQPVFRSSAVGGKPAFQFDGVSTTFAADLDINASTLPNVTILVEVQHNGGDGQPYSGIWGADLGGWGRFSSSVGTAGGSGVSNGGGFTGVLGLDVPAIPLAFTTILGGGTSNGSTAYVNGVLGATFTGSTNPNDTGLSIGSLNGPNHFISGYQEYGYIAEVFVYGEALSDTDRGTVEAYLMAKY